jgi:hypothetical protein
MIFVLVFGYFSFKSSVRGFFYFAFEPYLKIKVYARRKATAGVTELDTRFRVVAEYTPIKRSKNIVLALHSYRTWLVRFSVSHARYYLYLVLLAWR